MSDEIVYGRRITFHDEYHRRCREMQKKYDREISAIRRELSCDFKTAQRVRRKRRREAKQNASDA